MRMKLLALWPLLLIQMPTAFMSDASSSEDVFGNLAKRKRGNETSNPAPPTKKSAVSFHEQPVERVQARLNWVLLTTSEKKRGDLSCKKLEETAVKRGLSLPTSELDPTKPLCGLQLDPKTTVDADAGTDKFVNQVFDGLDIDPTLIGKSETGKILILTFKDGREARSAFSAKGRRYVLCGGVAEIIDKNRNLLAYIDFFANTNGISPNDFNYVDFRLMPESDESYQGLGKNRLVPHHITSLEGDDLEFNPQYLFYEDVGPLEPPYPIPYLGLKAQLVTIEKVKLVLGRTTVPLAIVEHAIGLIRLLQLYKALNPGCTFEDPGLKDLNKKLEALGDDETEEGAKALLLATCRFILKPKAGVIDMGALDWYPFWRILMKSERKVSESFAIQLNEHFDPKKTVKEDVCDDLVGKLAFYRDIPFRDKQVPYEIEIPCGEQRFTFRLIAAIGVGGFLQTFGTEWNSNEDAQILKVASYSSRPSFEIIYFPVEDMKKVSVRGSGEIFIYQYVSDEKRTRGTKVPGFETL